MGEFCSAVAVQELGHTDGPSKAVCCGLQQRRRTAGEVDKRSVSRSRRKKIGGTKVCTYMWNGVRFRTASWERAVSAQKLI